MLTRTAAEIAEENRRLCKARRAIAIDMAAHVAWDCHALGSAKVKSKILELIDIDQESHDLLVKKYKLKDRHG